MKGIITKVEATDSISTFNVVGEEHEVEFGDAPVLRQRFVVGEKGVGLWRTSVVTGLAIVSETETKITTLYSIYILKI